MSTITYQDFQKVDIRVGRVVKVEDFPEAKNPSYKLTIDFGPEVGVKVSSGQFVGAHPIKEKLVGKFVAINNKEVIASGENFNIVVKLVESKGKNPAYIVIEYVYPEGTVVLF